MDIGSFLLKATCTPDGRLCLEAASPMNVNARETRTQAKVLDGKSVGPLYAYCFVDDVQADTVLCNKMPCKVVLCSLGDYAREVLND